MTSLGNNTKYMHGHQQLQPQTEVTSPPLVKINPLKDTNIPPYISTHQQEVRTLAAHIS